MISHEVYILLGQLSVQELVLRQLLILLLQLHTKHPDLCMVHGLEDDNLGLLISQLLLAIQEGLLENYSTVQDIWLLAAFDTVAHVD